jgi:hypothetical protein
MKVIASQWPDQMPAKLSMVLPPWNDPEAWQAWNKTPTESQ